MAVPVDAATGGLRLRLNLGESSMLEIVHDFVAELEALFSPVESFFVDFRFSILARRRSISSCSGSPVVSIHSLTASLIAFFEVIPAKVAK